MVNSTPHNPVMPPVLILKLHAINTSSVPPHCSQLRPISNYRFADKSLARPTSRYILFDGLNTSFDASIVIYIYIYIHIYSTNIPLIMIINRIYEHQNLLSL